MEEYAFCTLCGNEGDGLLFGWYGYDGALCPSCRHEVVVAHDAQSKLRPWSGENYAHVRLGRKEGSQKRLLEGYEPRPTKDSLPYYPSVLAFILKEVLRTPQERQKYIEASQAYHGEKITVQVTTARLAPIQTSGVLEEMQEKKEYRQAMLFSSFPPE